jgi:hypothetical protein
VGAGCRLPLEERTRAGRYLASARLNQPDIHLRFGNKKAPDNIRALSFRYDRADDSVDGSCYQGRGQIPYRFPHHCRPSGSQRCGRTLILGDQNDPCYLRIVGSHSPVNLNGPAAPRVRKSKILALTENGGAGFQSAIRSA